MGIGTAIGNKVDECLEDKGGTSHCWFLFFDVFDIGLDKSEFIFNLISSIAEVLSNFRWNFDT